MQYRIYCEHFVRLLRMFGSLQTSNVYVQIFQDKYILRIYYSEQEYVQFLVEEQQFEPGIKDGVTILLTPATVESLCKLPLKDTKSDLILSSYSESEHITEYALTYRGMQYEISINAYKGIKYALSVDRVVSFISNCLYTESELSIFSNSVFDFKVDTKVFSDIVEINAKCALNQNYQLYINIKQGLILLNKDASIASYIKGQYILFDYEIIPDDLDEYLDFIVTKPKFISNFLTEVKIDLNTDISISSNIIHLNSYVSVGKKELFKYQLYLKFSSVINRLMWSNLLDLKNEIQRRGKTTFLPVDKIDKLLLSADEHDTESLLYIAKSRRLAADIVLRIFKPLIPKDRDDNFQGVEVVLHKDKLLVSNEDVFTIATLNIKLSDVEDSTKDV